MKNSILIASLFVWLTACSQKASDQTNSNSPSMVSVDLPSEIVPVEKSESEWKSQLNDIEYQVLREKGTERAFSGDLWDHKLECVYTCAGCELPLFDSGTKFTSGTGWPSFFKPLEDKLIKEERDEKFGMVRTEVLCARCEGHLGHVFNDGPKPTGLRYCINSVSLNYVEKKP